MELQQSIQSFLNVTGLESKNTQKTYETAINDFFNFVKNKDIDELTTDDLQVTLQQVEDYQIFLSKNYKRATVNLKIVAMRMLYKKLEKYGFNVDSTIFEIKKMKEHDVEHYGSLTVEEVNEIIKYVATLRNGYEKSLLVRLAFSTAFRKTSLLNAEFKNVQQKNKYYTIEVVGKGGKSDIKKIDKSLYLDLMNLKATTNRENIFTLSGSAVQRMMDSINKHFDFQDRNITFHSFKKASIEEVARITNYDIKAMQRQGNHSSVTTTLNSYMADKEVDDLVVVTNKIEKIDNSFIKKLTSDQMYDIICLLDSQTQRKIYNITKERGLLENE